jgi:hypothetical protein
VSPPLAGLSHGLGKIRLQLFCEFKFITPQHPSAVRGDPIEAAASGAQPKVSMDYSRVRCAAGAH